MLGVCVVTWACKVLKLSVTQCRSKGNISGGARKCWRREPLGGSGGMLPQKNLKSRDLEMLFPAFCYFVHCLSKPMRIDSITLATSITK